jgi:signal transduction histidine kinase
MFEKFIEQITKLSQLPVFTGGATEHTLFVFLLIVFFALCAIVIIFLAKYIIKGIQEIWSRMCDMYNNTLNAKVQKEQEYTKQIAAAGKTSKSQF